MVGAIDCIKQYNDWKTSFGFIQELHGQKTKTKITRNKPAKSRLLAKKLDEAKLKETNNPKPEGMTKVERKAHYALCKRTLQKHWDLVTDSGSGEECDNPDLPDKF